MCADNCLNYVPEKEENRDLEKKELLNLIALKDDKGNDLFLKTNILFLLF